MVMVNPDGEFRFPSPVTLKCRCSVSMVIPIVSPLELHWGSASSSRNGGICFTWSFASSFIFPPSETSECSPVMLLWKGILVLFLCPALFYFSSIFFALYFSSSFSIGKYKGLLFHFLNLMLILWSLPTTVVLSTRSNISWAEKKRQAF